MEASCTRLRRAFGPSVVDVEQQDVVVVEAAMALDARDGEDAFAAKDEAAGRFNEINEQKIRSTTEEECSSRRG